MLLTYTQFRGVPLPIYDPVEGVGGWPARSSYTDMAGDGAFRLYGAQRSPRATRTERRQGMLLIEDTGSDPTVALAALDSAFGALKAEIGRTGRLDAQGGGGNAYWTDAELLDVRATAEPRTLFRFRRYVALDVETELILPTPFWYGNRHGTGGWTWDSGVAWDSGYLWDDVADQYTLDVSPKTLNIANDGNLPVKNAILTVTAAGTPITNLIIGIGAATCTYAGTIAVGQSLVIDTGAMSVTNTGVGDYANFTPPATQAEWLVLQPGNNDVVVTRTGGANATILFEFSDHFA